MKLASLTTLMALLATSAFAQTVEDMDGDGLYSMEELKVAFPDLSEEIFAAVDTNADGMIDPDELTAAQEAGVLAS